MQMGRFKAALLHDTGAPSGELPKQAPKGF
jgi:hypothetical protein